MRQTIGPVAWYLFDFHFHLGQPHKMFSHRPANPIFWISKKKQQQQNKKQYPAKFPAFFCVSFKVLITAKNGILKLLKYQSPSLNVFKHLLKWWYLSITFLCWRSYDPGSHTLNYLPLSFSFAQSTDRPTLTKEREMGNETFYGHGLASPRLNIKI